MPTTPTARGANPLVAFLERTGLSPDQRVISLTLQGGVLIQGPLTVESVIAFNMEDIDSALLVLRADGVDNEVLKIPWRSILYWVVRP